MSLNMKKSLYRPILLKTNSPYNKKLKLGTVHDGKIFLWDNKKYSMVYSKACNFSSAYSKHKLDWKVFWQNWVHLRASDC